MLLPVCLCSVPACDLSRPAGEGLVEVFDSDPVQEFFSGMTSRELHPEKAIYKPGILRKVTCKDMYSCTYTLHPFTCT